MTLEEEKDLYAERMAKLPKPVTVADLETLADEVCIPARATQYRKWIEKEGSRLCLRLNEEKEPAPARPPGKSLGVTPCLKS